MTHRLEDILITIICNPIPQRNIYRITFPLANPNIPGRARSRKELAILVETDGHHTVGGVECFLDTIAVMDVYIYI
jgi:hypothetical protein